MLLQSLAAILFVVAFLGLLKLTEWIYYRYQLAADTSRKFMHVSGGFLSLWFPLFFTNHWWVLGLCSLAFGILAGTYLYKLLPSVHQVSRLSIGSVVFPVPVYFCFLLAENYQQPALFYLPLLILTVSDTVAEIGGKRWGKVSFMFAQKTVVGSALFALSSFGIACTSLAVVTPLPLVAILQISSLIALATTIAEAVSLKGLDNLTVPVVAATAMIYVPKVLFL